MAFKFQLGAAVMSGSLEQEGDINIDGGVYKLDGALVIETNRDFLPRAISASAEISSSAQGLFKTIQLEDASGLAGGMLDVVAGVPNKLTVDLSEAAAAEIAAGDHMIFLDGGANGAESKGSINDLAGVFAGTVTATGLADSSGVISIDINNLDAETVATGDTIIFNDNDDNGLHKETIDDLFGIGPALVTEAAMVVADDYITFLDGGATGACKKEKWADIAALIAGSGISATNGVLAATGGSSLDVQWIGNENGSITGGLTFGAVTLNANRVWTLPSGSNGDVVRVKAPALGGNTLTISGAYAAVTNGPYVDNEAHGAIIESDFASITLVYATSSAGGLGRDQWYII
tara:strand:- start:2649 stop:3692 length:1044 start_codon:yes stop_codon:yes gene_type:complete